MLTPRDYQVENIKDILQKLQHHQRCLYYAPTGAGKTTFAALLANEAVKYDRQIRFYVHRDKLVGQTVKTFERVGLKCGIVAGGYKYHRGCPVQVISVQTLSSGQRDFTWLDTGDRKPLSFVDECHVTQYYDVMQKLFPMLPNEREVEDEGFLIGLTGTPWRLKTDESMGQFFKQLVCAPSYAELISLGYLVEPVYYRVRNEPGGDMEADIEFCISQWKDKSQGSSTFLFTSSVAFANLACKKFNDAGIPSAVVTGKTSRKQRDDIFGDFEQEKTKVLISKDVLSEGCDIPKARVALFAAFTESKAKFVQRAGRVLRTFTYPDGRKKNDCIILDQMGLLRRLTPSGLEGITVDDSVLAPPEPRQPGEMPMKECPECDRLNWISARFCVDCGYEFEIVGTERSRPSGTMDRYFPDLEKKMQFAFYQRRLRKAWLDDKPPSHADLDFLKKFGRYAPLDWKRDSVLKNGTPEDKERYRLYLVKHAPKNKNATAWAEGQLSLHLGI